MNPLSENKAWSYVGRFITNFAMIENMVNQLFDYLLRISYNQPAGAVAVDTWITIILDLRKKLELIDIILKRRGVDESKTFKQVHELHDLRNVICHFPFEEEFEGALSCDYLNKCGSNVFKILGKSEKDNSITYAEFDHIDAIARELYKKLFELMESATPITEVSDELRDAMKEVIGSSVH